MIVVGLCGCAWLAPKDEAATIKWTDVRQQIDGFGAASVSIVGLKGITDEQADLFFDPTKGVGISLLRSSIQPDGSSTEIVTAQKAVARGAKVWGAPWSPPANFKTNGKLAYGGSLIRSNYKAWADILARYVQMMKSKGVPIYAVSVQNEPEVSVDYPSCIYSAQDIHDFVPFLHTALQDAGVGNTKIMIAEDAEWRIDLAKVSLADPNVSKDVAIVAAHAYGGNIQPFKTGSAHLWETEVFDRDIKAYDGSIAEGLKLATIIHKFLTIAGVNAWHWWTLTTDDNDNGGLTDLNVNPAKRLYILGQWSKFVRPGWNRIGVSYSGPLQITAFKDSGNTSFAIVVVNSAAIATAEKFNLNGFSTGSITPWITSSNFSLAAQAPVSVSGTTFTYTLPPLSVTTFYGNAQKTN